MVLSRETLEILKALMQQVVLSPAEEDFVSKAKKVIQVWEEINLALDEQQPHNPEAV